MEIQPRVRQPISHVDRHGGEITQITVKTVGYVKNNKFLTPKAAASQKNVRTGFYCPRLSICCCKCYCNASFSLRKGVRDHTNKKKKKHRVCLNIFIFLKVVFYYLRQLASHKNICSPFQWQ